MNSKAAGMCEKHYAFQNLNVNINTTVRIMAIVDMIDLV
jgi:hypothetical protein